MGKAPNITMAKGTKKATRKFEKNHLKDTLEKRKAGAKIKQRNQVKAKRQARNAKDADLAEVDELSGSEDEQPKKKKKKSKNAPVEEVQEEQASEEEAEDASELTKEMVAKWTKAMKEQHSLRAMRQVVLAFRAAAHVNEDDGKEYKYSISNSQVYHELLVTALKYVPEVLNHHIPVKETAAGKVRVSTDSKKFKTLTALLKSYTSSVHHLLTALSDAPTLKLTLASITPLLPYLLSFKKVLKNIVKTVVNIWSDTSSDEATRITAFLVLRRLAVIGDPGLREAVLKTVYQGLIKGSRSWLCNWLHFHSPTCNPSQKQHHQQPTRIVQDGVQLAICTLIGLLVMCAIRAL